MSRLPGRVDWSPPDLDGWLRRLAGLLPPIHAATLPPPGAGVIRPFVPYEQGCYQPPGWARWPGVWTRAVAWFRRPAPDGLGAGPEVFVHRDFVLWRRGRVSGVVDWASAGVGPGWVDVGYCRGSLFAYGLEVADRFTAIWERLSGRRFHPWADVVTIIGGLDDLRDDLPSARERPVVEDALARAVAELDGIP